MSLRGPVVLWRWRRREDVVTSRRSLRFPALDTGFDEVRGGEGDVVGWTVVLNVRLASLCHVSKRFNGMKLIFQAMGITGRAAVGKSR